MVDIRIEDCSKLGSDEIKNRFSQTRESLEQFMKAEKVSEAIIEDVLKYGDEALIKYTEQFDNVTLKRSNIRVSDEDIERFSSGFDKTFIEALEVSIKRVTEFHKKDLPTDWFFRDEYGNRLGQIYSPVERVGLYVPGGKALYPSSVVMTAVPALVAGVRDLSLASPPSSFRNPSEVCLAAKLIGGIKRFYRVGGVQVIAAMALGTENIKKVDKIVGPGNIYVAAAKKLLYGVVDIDMIAGPSEVVVVWDGSGSPSLVAADILAQAEHDEDARAVCIVYNIKHAEAIRDFLNQMFPKSKRKEIIGKSLKQNGRIIVVKEREIAIEIINNIAPEHLEIITEDAESYLDGIKNAGAVFLGRYSPVALGDYIAGPSHVLPTGSTARFFSPLNVRSFYKLSSIVELSPLGCEKLGRFASIIADKEGLYSHKHSIEVRKEC